MSLRFALASDRGKVRENNEDHVRAEPERGLFVLADGMGGHVAGEVASEVAVSSCISAVLKEAKPRRIRDEAALVEGAMHAANEAVVRAASDRGLFGMGTTLTTTLVRGRTATIGHVGDSRAYVVTNRLRQLTTDHTVVAMLVEGGILSPEEVVDHPDRHVLTQALGTQDLIEPDVIQTRVPSGGRILLSSDGLHDVVPDDEILAAASRRNLEEACAALVTCAKDHGAPDNVSVVLIEP